MAAVVGSLLVELQADSGQLSKALTAAGYDLTKLEGKTTRSLSKMDSEYSSRFAGMSKSALSFGKSLATGVAAIGIVGIVSGFREIASSVADIGAEAQKAGLSTKAFQELGFVAGQNRIAVDALTDGMKELALRTDEFIISGGKTGSAAEAFKRLGLTVDELKTKIKDPSALLTEIVGKVQSLDKAAQIRIFDELFGGSGGEQMVRLLARGEQGIRDQIKAANDLSIVIDEGVIKRAAEVDAKFQAIATTIGSNLKSAVVSAFSALSEFVESYRDIQNQSNTALDNQISGLGEKRLDLENQILAKQQEQREGIEKLSDTARNLGFENSENSALAGNGGQIDALKKQLSDLAETEAALVDERNKRSTMLKPITVKGDGGYSGGAAVPTTGGAKSDPYKRAVENLREHTEALKAETAAQGALNPLVNDYGFAVAKAAAQQDLLNAAKEGGRTITPELTAEIDKLSTAYANGTLASERLATSQDQIRQRAEEMAALQKEVTSGIVTGFLNGEKAADIFISALKRIGDSLINDVLNNLFKVDGAGGGSIFGSLFGGGFKANTTMGSFLTNGFDDGGPTGSACFTKPEVLPCPR